jgi:hypothetical protein
MYGSSFHADGEDFHGMVNGHVSKILEAVNASTLLFTQHAVSNILIELNGDGARAESYFTSFHQFRDEQGMVWDEAIKGRYLDELRRGPDMIWKIQRRVVVWDWSRIEPPRGSWFDRMRMRPGTEDRFIFGRRDKKDLVYTYTLPPELGA